MEQLDDKNINKDIDNIIIKMMSSMLFQDITICDTATFSIIKLLPTLSTGHRIWWLNPFQKYKTLSQEEVLYNHIIHMHVETYSTQ